MREATFEEEIINDRTTKSLGLKNPDRDRDNSEGQVVSSIAYNYNTPQKNGKAKIID